MKSIICAAVLLALVPFAALAEDAVKPIHGIAMHGAPKYPADFKHFDYVNPDATKGGELRLGAQGTFDSLNPFILRGSAAGLSALIYDTLTVASLDEPFTRYGLVAETMEVPADRSWVIFNLRTEAKFHDGRPITADDVIFTFQTLVEQGRPIYAYYYASVAKVEKLGPLKVKFTFKPGENRELPLIISELAVLPKHYWEGRDFKAPTLDPPLGSGPYKLARFEAGRWITVERVKDYWGAKLAVNVGRYNFDSIRVDYYRDATVLREALKSGRIDYREENQAKAWATEYDLPEVKEKKLVKREVPVANGGGMQAFVFNTRRPMFKDARVRQALSYAFDFEYANRTLFNGQYTRTKSYFENSDLAARGLPQGEELKILERFRGRVPEEVFTKEFTVPTYKDERDFRNGLRMAFRLLKEAGWAIKDTKLVDAKTGKPMRFEIITFQQEFERIYLPFVQNLKRLGVEAHVRLVDPSQYEERLRKFDFDVTTLTFGQSLSPGNEQRNYWSSAAADREGSYNYIGVKDKVVDELVELIIAAPDREALVARSKALDRVLLWHHYVIPQWYVPYDRLVYWDKFGTPGKPTINGESVYTWWVDAKKEAALGSALKRN